MPAADGAGDHLLWALSGWATATAAQFRRACDTFAPAGPDSGPGAARHARTAARRALQSLGHLDTAAGHAAVAVPWLAELPLPGLPRAVLCGARGPGTAAGLTRACAAFGAECTVSPQGDRQPLAPARIEVTAGSREELAALAARLGLRYCQRPASWAALSAATGLDRWKAGRVWAAGPELNWPRRDFDVTACRFRDSREGAATGPQRLSAYQDPASQQFRHYLWRGDQSAPADRDWGRYAALAAQRNRVLFYAPLARAAAAPRTAPLPAELARALVLSSGWAPRPLRRGDLAVPAGEHGWDLYEGVPPDTYREVARLAGQPP